MQRLLVIAGALALAVPVYAADLNAPLVDKPTLGSEISRGFHAAYQCGDSDPLTSSTCIFDTSAAEQQRRTNYQPFQLGLFFGALVHFDSQHQTDLSLTDNYVAQDREPLVACEAHSMFVVYRSLQAKLGVTDAQVLLVTELTGKVSVESMQHWATYMSPKCPQ